MFYTRFLKWLSRLPGAYALGLLWWAEITVLLCTLAGGHFLSVFFFEYIKKSYEFLLFPLAIVTYFVVLYIIHWAFAFISQEMEGLLNLHRLGGLERVELIREDEKKRKEEVEEKGTELPGEFVDPLVPPERIRASAQIFRFRYFVVLPSALVLYLLSFVSTIYKIFSRQIQTWETGRLILPASAAVIISCWCFWILIQSLPGYVSVRRLMGHRKPGGE